MRTAPFFVAALLCAALSLPTSATALTIGPPPPQNTTSLAALRADYEARLARQAASYESQLAGLRRQLEAAKRQKSAADKSIARLTAQLETLRSAATTEQVQTLTTQNEALKTEYAAVLRARAQQSDEIDQLKAEKAVLAQKAGAIKQPLYLDPFAWLVLVAGLGLGGLVGLRVGLKRGENRATSSIPANVAAWWGGDKAEATKNPL